MCSPSGISTRADATTSIMACPCAPAFITTAPPSDAGMPAANSSPDSPCRAAARARCGSPAPACAVTRSPSSVMRSSPFPIFRTIPRIPRSEITTLLPWPSTTNGTRSVNSQVTTARNSSRDRGTTSRSAGPPTRKDTCFRSGSPSRTSRHTRPNMRRASACPAGLIVIGWRGVTGASPDRRLLAPPPPRGALLRCAPRRRNQDKKRSTRALRGFEDAPSRSCSRVPVFPRSRLCAGPERRHQFVGGPPDVAGPEGEDESPGTQHGQQMAHDALSFGNERHRPVRTHRLNDQRRGDTGNRLLIGGVDGGHNQMVTIRKRRGGAPVGRLGPGVAGWLEHGGDAPVRPGLFGPTPDRRALYRSLGVVIHHHDTAHLPPDGKTPAHPAEALQRLCHLGENYAQLQRHRRRSQGVEHVIAARDVQHQWSQTYAIAPEGASRLPAGEALQRGRVAGGPHQSIRNGAGRNAG